jgi:hypothetical protein
VNNINMDLGEIGWRTIIINSKSKAISATDSGDP